MKIGDLVKCRLTHKEGEIGLIIDTAIEAFSGQKIYGIKWAAGGEIGYFYKKELKVISSGRTNHRRKL